MDPEESIRREWIEFNWQALVNMATSLRVK
jgi:hypothetical protein